MKSIFKYLLLFLIGWMLNNYEVKAGSKLWASPGEVASNPTGAGKVYINEPHKPNVQPKRESDLGYVATKHEGGSKAWDEQLTSSKPSNCSITMGCNPYNGWFFIGWTEDVIWSSEVQFVSEEMETTIDNALPYYDSGQTSSNSKETVNWANNNLDICKFYFANFARVKATTDDTDGSTDCSPIINKDGDVVTLTASVNSGSDKVFSHWEVNGSPVSTDNPLTFTVASGNYGEYKAVFSSNSYPEDGTYLIKNVGTNNYASYGGNIHIPNAKRTKDYCRQFTIAISESGEITSFTSDGNDVYGNREALISFASNALNSLGVSQAEVSSFVNGATKIHLEKFTGGYRAYHQIPALSSSVSWTDIKEAIVNALPESSFSLPDQRYITKAVNSIEPDGKYYLVATNDGEEIVYSTDGTTNYSLWNTDNLPTQYAYFTSYYTWSHLKNIGTGGLASFIGNNFSESTNVDFSGVATLKEYLSGTSDPGAVFFIRNSASQSDMYSQGYGIRNDKDWLKINANEDLSVKITPTWYEAAQLSTNDGVNIIANGTYADWALEPISSTTMDRYYFGAKCSAKYTDGKGHYYTTMYTYFPYECMDGVKAYYLSSSGVDLDNKRITLQEITSGKVPANTAVVLECEGLTPIENRLIPLDCSYDYNTNVLQCSSVSSITDNVLIGVYFNLKTDKYENRTAYNADRYLTFSIANGLLGFYKHNSLQYLTPGKAYLDLNKLASAGVKDLSNFTLSFERSEEATGIGEISGGSDVIKSQMHGVYNIMGVKVADRIEGSNLPKGVYIINGKKFIVR